MGMRAEPLELSQNDIEVLTKIAVSRTDEVRKVQRAKILLMAAEGKTHTYIAATVGLSRPSVNLCINKYREGGINAAFSDRARKGRPSSISDDGKVWILNIACQKPAAFGYAQELWTIRKLTEHIKSTCEDAGYVELKTIAPSKVWTILHEASIKPHKIRYYLERRDPDFESKMRDVLVVYKQVEMMLRDEGNATTPDGPKTIFLSYHEKPGIQAIANVTEDRSPTAEHGFIARDSEYKRLGTLSLLAGIDLLTGEITPLVSDTHKSSDFIEFLKRLDEKHDKRDRIRLILDNHSVHTSRETIQYLNSVPGRFEFVFTPKHGSWLNLRSKASSANSLVYVFVECA